MLSWYKELKGEEKRTFWACFGGYAMDAMDVQIYSFVIPALLSLWQLAKIGRGPALDKRVAPLRVRWLDHRDSRRSHRPGAHAPDHHRLVFSLHFSFRSGP